MKYQINSLIGKNCITSEDGEKIYELIHSKLVTRNPVELDFTGVNIFASPFFNAAIGQLFKDIQPATIESFLTLSGLNSVGQKLDCKVRENANNYYSNEIVRQAVGEMLMQEAARF